MPATINLINGWENDIPIFRFIKNADMQSENVPDDSAFNKRQAGGNPNCGNPHAGFGKSRLITKDCEILLADTDLEINSAVQEHLPFLGKKILISAGHFMPVKHKPDLVNSNSYKLLLHGIKTLKYIREGGGQADLLITINDVTIGQDDLVEAEAPTMDSCERENYYRHFRLPALYRKEIEALYAELGNVFSVFVVGENKLSERLSKTAGKLKDLGAFASAVTSKGYILNFDAERMIKLAHNSYSGSSIFISNEPGISGRPKCVRACTKLAALPHELNYTGFVQFLPVCSRNALEGFLVGTEIFKRKYGKEIPYISVHTTRSCF